MIATLENMANNNIIIIATFSVTCISLLIGEGISSVHIGKKLEYSLFVGLGELVTIPSATILAQADSPRSYNTKKMIIT